MLLVPSEPFSSDCTREPGESLGLTTRVKQCIEGWTIMFFFYLLRTRRWYYLYCGWILPLPRRPSNGFETGEKHPFCRRGAGDLVKKQLRLPVRRLTGNHRSIRQGNLGSRRPQVRDCSFGTAFVGRIIFVHSSKMCLLLRRCARMCVSRSTSRCTPLIPSHRSVCGQYS